MKAQTSRRYGQSNQGYTERNHARPVDLPALVAQRVRLRRTGRLWTGCCPFHAENTPSFTVWPDHFHCFGCGAHGDAIDWLRRSEGLGFAAARGRLGDSPSSPSPRRSPSSGASRYAARLVAQSRPIAGTLAERYLRDVRGFGDLPLPAELRFHPGVWSAETKSHHPALILPAREGERIARVQAVLLDPQTAGKAALAAPKLTFGAGAAHVPASFAGRCGFVLLSEGPEKAIALHAVMGWRSDASLGAESLGKPHYPRGTLLMIVGDNGEAGHREAAAAAEAHRARGCDVWTVFPPEGVKDIDALLCRDGADAVRTLIESTIADDPPPTRPNCSIGQMRDVVQVETAAWLSGQGPAHLLNNGVPSLGKGQIPLELLAELAADRRAARKRFIADWRRDHPGASAHAAAEAADDAGVRLLRVGYFSDNHTTIAQHVAKARALGMSAAHDAGLDRPHDPGDPHSPPRCTQPERVTNTRIAGEPVKLVACGLDLLGPHCPDREGCRAWQSSFECQVAEFVGAPIDRTTAPHLPRELRGLDFVLLDEPPSRVFTPERDAFLDLLDDHLFMPHPVRGEDGTPDPDATETARGMYAALRAQIDAAQNGYWPRDALLAAGLDGAWFARFVALTDRRDHRTGMTAATEEDERKSLARASFRPKVRKLCAFGRLAQAIQAGAEDTGRIELAGDAPRVAILRPRPKLHPVLLSARIMVTGARLDIGAIRRWLPDAAEMGIAGMVPHAPHQTVVHFHRGMGKRAMQSGAKRRWARALVALEGDDSRPDATGVLIHKAHEHEFRDMPGVIAGHHGGIVGRKDWERCSTFIGFGSRYLSPTDAAAAGAALTGEEVPVKRPVRMLRRIAMTDGGSVSVPVWDYAHPAAAAANREVAAFDSMQGVFGRPRAPNRTAANPLLSIDVSKIPPRDVQVDFLITSPTQYAPDRMVCMLAEGLAVEGSRDRHRVHPAIYPHGWTGQNDRRLEAGGFLATVLRVLSPPWRQGPREAWVVGRYWPAGRGRRTEGRTFVSTVRQLALSMLVLRERCGADRIVVDREIRAGEVTINPVKQDKPAFIVTSPDLPAEGAVSASVESIIAGWRADRPPDG